MSDDKTIADQTLCIPTREHGNERAGLNHDRTTTPHFVTFKLPRRSMGASKRGVPSRSQTPAWECIRSVTNG